MIRKGSFLASLVLLLPGLALAQEAVGTLAGTATSDQTHKPLPAARVTATNASDHAEPTVVTDAQGKYRIQHLPAGAYSLRFQADGYQPYTRSNVQVQADATKSVDAALEPKTPAGQ